MVLLIVWGPLHWMQQPIPVLVMIGLVVLGVEVLRRQTAREFPTIPDAGAAIGSRTPTDDRRGQDAGRKGQEAVSGAVASAVSRRRRRGAHRGLLGGRRCRGCRGRRSAGPGAGLGDDKLERLERLASLHDRGHLTDEEFAAQKAQILAPRRDGGSAGVRRRGRRRVVVAGDAVAGGSGVGGEAGDVDGAVTGGVRWCGAAAV